LFREDKNQFLNLPLINTLRIPDKDDSLFSTIKAQAEEEEGQEKQKPMDTVPNPPSFYYNDIEKWNAKFAKHIKDREYIKKQFQKSSELTCRTVNSNVRQQEDRAKSLSKSHDPKDARPSLFGKVLERRKSRQSTCAPGVIDFDYAGDSSQFHHLIIQRKDLGFPDTTRLNFEMKLRCYKNTTDYNANQPWCFPSVKQFSPRRQWAQRKKD
jgi:hypothetical protein